MADVKALVEQLVNLTIIEVTELSKILKEEYNIEPAATAVAVAGPVGGGGNAADGAEEKTEFNVVLKESGASKLGVVKEVKNLLGVGLKDAKDMVDNCPTTLKEGVNKDEAEEIKKKLEDVGAVVELT